MVPVRLASRKLKIDSKGRISIPSGIRKNFRLSAGSEVEIVFDIRKDIIFLVCGPGGAISSTKDCGSFDAGEKPVPGPGDLNRDRPRKEPREVI
ncbi:MAG: AbrB/MazE/SpoVT family DNA-binding domain-containing protein [Candidatus Aenigmarchaeota archaeon]|nr:AbrB/MazE/SpoVT family DNA-binding domain-containing protein [Candidatus Aenigmarchaeota archaeon]